MRLKRKGSEDREVEEGDGLASMEINVPINNASIGRKVIRDIGEGRKSGEVRGMGFEGGVRIWDLGSWTVSYCD